MADRTRVAKAPVQGSDVWQWRRFRAIRHRHRGTSRSTTWRLTTCWGREQRGLTGVEFTWHHRNREGGNW